MPEEPNAQAAPDPRSPWVIDTRELSRRAGTSRDVHRKVPIETPLGVPDVLVMPAGADIELSLLLESVVEGVLVTGTATAPTKGNCSRCLDPITGQVEVDVTELFAYPGSTTEATTDEDEVGRLVDDMIDLEPVVRDALVLALPLVPLCQEDCAGLCVDCGVKWADLKPGHRHETIDARWAALVDRFSESSSDSSADTVAEGSTKSPNE
jgi:uncharacterized protein